MMCFLYLELHVNFDFNFKSLLSEIAETLASYETIIVSNYGYQSMNMYKMLLYRGQVCELLVQYSLYIEGMAEFL